MSVGVSTFAHDEDDVGKLLRRADLRMYAAKHPERVAVAVAGGPRSEDPTRR